MIVNHSLKMVYYHTSANVKMLRNIIIDYRAAGDLSPYEYMKMYIEKCPESMDDTKLAWIAETFLGIQKHAQFLKQIASHMSEELTEVDQDYFMIILHAIAFQITPKDTQYIYKCLFNLNKHLLNTLTTFLSNNEVLTYISQVAQAYYDTNYVTEKVIDPLFAWQPYISEMAHSYAEYVKKINSRKLKPPTIPIQPNVLNRPCKTLSPQIVQSSFPATPPNSLHNKKTKMLTKSTIDQKLKYVHEKNKQKAVHLLREAQTNEHHYTQNKSEKYFKRLESIRNESEISNKALLKQQCKLVLKNPAPIKDTKTTLKRMNKRIQLEEQEEIEWLQDIVKNCRNATNIEALAERDRQEKKRELLHDIERKHILGQISYEEAVLAKIKLHMENKKKYEDFLKEKESWNDEIEKWKKKEIEKNRKSVEKLSMIELNLLQAKHNNFAKKKENVEKIKKESEEIMARFVKEKQEELERRVKMIKEIKILALVCKKAKVPKIIDLTETSGLGLLCEMSMAELQERLNAMKIGLKDELENKKELIKDYNRTMKRELEETKNSVSTYIAEREISRKQKKKPKANAEPISSKEINDLKKILEDKRKLRMKLSNI